MVQRQVIEHTYKQEQCLNDVTAKTIGEKSQVSADYSRKQAIDSQPWRLSTHCVAQTKESQNTFCGSSGKDATLMSNKSYITMAEAASCQHDRQCQHDRNYSEKPKGRLGE